MTMTETTTIEIPLRAQRGEIWFSINLGLIEDVPALYQVLGELNLTPKLAYMRTREGIEVHLLLHHEQRLELSVPPDELLWREQQVLSDAINPDAMHFFWSPTIKVAA